ncbi:MAG TPA: hypothetical protein VHM72_06365 [Solirubrobacteraceae bacterium]|nr:hypothetical protein [Solirubrobacteraceae bacterium]
MRGVRFSLFGVALVVLALAAASSNASSLRAVALGATTGAPVTIVTDPVGLSVEYPVLAADLGTASCPSPELISTIEGLGVPTIRIGGNSGDQTAPAGTPPFAGVTDLPAAFWSQLGCLESQTHEPFVVGLNLASQMPAWAATMAAGARSAVPANLLSFEIGNEADIDGPSVAWWNATAEAKSLLPFPTYLDDVEAVEQQLGPGAGVEGPDFATPRWTSQIPQIAAALSLHAIDAHFYPLNACTGLRQATVAALLARGAAEPGGAALAILAQAERVHLPMVISESNSVACRGKPGVSDSPASAVWGLRLVINMIMSGIESVRFHSSGSSYDPFVVSGDTVTTRPLYLGLESAVRLLPVGATVTTLRTPKALSGVVVSSESGHTSYIVTSYASSAKLVTVRASGAATILRVSPSGAIVTTSQIDPTAGKLRVSLAPNTVAAITLG